MPAFREPSPGPPSDDIWHRHKSKIRKLYQEKNKTIKQVKETLEMEPDFPKKP